MDSLRLLPLIGPVNHSQGLTTLARLRLAQGNSEAVLPLLKQLETLQEEASNRFTRRWLVIAIAETTCALYWQEPTTALRGTFGIRAKKTRFETSFEHACPKMGTSNFRAELCNRGV